MQFILSNYNEKYPESNLSIINSCLIPEYGHKYIYTMNKKDIDGLHKDKLHRLTPSSFTVKFRKILICYKINYFFFQYLTFLINVIIFGI